MNTLIGDIGNTTTKICLINNRSCVFKKVIYFNSINILSNVFLKNKLKKILKKDKINKFALFSSVVPKYQDKVKNLFIKSISLTVLY